jgi:hypothetical protein
VAAPNIMHKACLLMMTAAVRSVYRPRISRSR